VASALHLLIPCRSRWNDRRGGYTSRPLVTRWRDRDLAGERGSSSVRSRCNCAIHDRK